MLRSTHYACRLERGVSTDVNEPRIRGRRTKMGTANDREDACSLCPTNSRDMCGPGRNDDLGGFTSVAIVNTEAEGPTHSHRDRVRQRHYARQNAARLPCPLHRQRLCPLWPDKVEKEAAAEDRRDVYAHEDVVRRDPDEVVVVLGRAGVPPLNAVLLIDIIYAGSLASAPSPHAMHNAPESAAVPTDSETTWKTIASW